jgi:ferric-dicitrate binding protein FerR (iron transport regulator)
MMNSPEDIVRILVRYALHEPLDRSEEQTLEEWRLVSQDHAAFLQQLRDSHWVAEQQRQIEEPPTAEMWDDIKRYIENEEPRAGVRPRRRMARRWIPAAALFLIIATGLLYWWKPTGRSKGLSVFRTFLTRSDGTTIRLDTVSTGRVIACEGGILLRKADSNSYIYEFVAGQIRAGAAHHRLTIAPDGGVCRIRWLDGSRAWLAPGTSIDYPVGLRGGKVNLRGEAWFSVSPDASKPLAIEMPHDIGTKVLGTSFDIRTIGAGTTVALFAGSVQVSAAQKTMVLRPGMRADISTDVIKLSRLPENDTTLRWLRPSGQSPEFTFRNADLLTILRAIANWHRLQVINPGNLRGGALTAGFSPNMPLSRIMAILQMMEGDQVHLELREDTIFVRSK